MFGFLKDKLKKAVSIFSKKVDEEAEEVSAEKLVEKEPAIKTPEKKKENQKKVEKKTEKISEKNNEKIKSAPAEKAVEEKSAEKEQKKIVEEQIQEPTEEEIPTEPVADEQPKEEPEKKSFFQRIKESVTTKKISADKFEELFIELELIMLENNVSLAVVDKIKEDLKQELVDKPLPRSEIITTIQKTLRKSIEELFSVPAFDIVKKTSEKKPFVIAFVGVNGSGKTTQLAKITHLLQKNKKTCVIAACDTFRAAAIQQLEEHAKKLNTKIIKHDYGADPAAVAFDAIEHAKARDIDVVLIDTAGRLHSNSNLMAELKKIVRVAKPDITIFVGESITGNDCVEQAVQFGAAIPLDAVILTKADVDEKGGAAVSISYVTGKPILFFGTGQAYEDLQAFEKEFVLNNLGL